MSTDLELTELMCARFCHDLAGPVGAVNNGMEFLREDNTEMQGRAMELIEASAKEAVIRLQFFRQAYGSVSSLGEADLSHLKALTEQMFSLGKITLDWPDQHTEAAGVSLSHRMGRLILNCIIIVSSALIHGGTASIRLQKLDGGKRVSVRGEGKDIKIDPEISTILSGTGVCNLTKRNVQVHYTLQLAKQLGIQLSVHQGQHSIEIMADYVRATNPIHLETYNSNIQATT